MATALRTYREKQGMKRKEFAALLGIPQSTYRSLENGWRPITPERAMEIEKRTGGGLTRERLLRELFKGFERKQRRSVEACA